MGFVCKQHEGGSGKWKEAGKLSSTRWNEGKEDWVMEYIGRRRAKEVPNTMRHYARAKLCGLSAMQDLYCERSFLSFCK
jgi:hypothetical protein